MALGVIAINEKVDHGDSSDLLLALKLKSVGLRSVTAECASGYHQELNSEKMKKDDVGQCFVYCHKP